MRILLVGAQGQVGSAISRVFANTDLVALAKQELDITEPHSINAVCSIYQPKLIINAAAYTSVDKAESESESAFNINHEGALNLAKTCHALQIPLIHLSTDYVFDGTKNNPYHEEDIPNPNGVYALSKWQGEEAIRVTCPQHIILRVSWVFGREGHNFVKTILKLAQTRDTLNIVADQYGAPTYADDIARALLDITQQLSVNPCWGTYHFCNLPATTWYEFACAIVGIARSYTTLKVTQINPILTKDYPTPAKRPSNSRLACDKIRDVFHVTCADWQGGLHETVRTYLNV